MALPELTIIPAGAGSGKTYTIQTTLAQWIKNGDIEPDKIVAVTFTEAAAAELRGRIRDELICQNRHHDALKLDQAYISTIHGFGLRILSEFAFDAGLNPAPRMLSEDEEKILVRLALAGNDHCVAIIKDLNRFGYKYDFSNKKSPEDIFRDSVLAVMDKLRSIGRFEPDPELIEQALERIRSSYGTIRNENILRTTLVTAIENLLQQFPEDISTICKTTSGVAKKITNNYKLYRKALTGRHLKYDWRLWNDLRNLQLSTPRNTLPEGYDQLAQIVMDAADGILDHPGPLQDALGHAKSLLDTAQSSLSHYAQHKAQRGLLDFTDMLALTQQMLYRHPEIIKLLAGRFQCLVIDEFQDTNPLQFSLLWAFRQAGVPTLIVGDLKQAIMGFQNADARLLAEIQRQNETECKPLTGNWRTHKNLMSWVNEVGTGLFGDEYTNLEPKADFDSSLSSLELIEFSARGNGATRAEHTVTRIKALLDDDKCVVFDRHQKISRKIRGGDIAIICPKNKRLKVYAEILRTAGIRCQIDEDGWFASRAVQLLYYSLCFVADPLDDHAALYLAVTELGKESLETALKTVLNSGELINPVHKALLAVRDGAVDRSVPTLVAEVIAALDLYGTVATWGDAAQLRANLLRFQAEATEFEAANREALASGGYYGSELKSFLLWLEDRADKEDQQPQARVQDEDAVQLVTWHRSKGREWPVVVVCGSEIELASRLPSVDVNYSDFSDLGKIIERARLDVSPSYIASEQNEPFLEELDKKLYDSARRLLYVALTRAREKVIIEWPSYLDNGKERQKTTYWELFTHDTGMRTEANTLVGAKKAYPCRITKVGKDRSALFDDESTFAETEPPTTLLSIGRRAIKLSAAPQNLTPETVRPSIHEIDDHTNSLDLTTITYADQFTLELDMPSAVQGTLLHRCFEVLDSSCTIEILQQATAYNFTTEQFTALKNRIAKFDFWVQDYFQPTAIQKEPSILAVDANGSVINGFIDLLIETDDGFWIIDHKSDRTTDRQKRFAEHLPQLMLYRDALLQTRTDKPVLGAGIHWMGFGEVMLIATHVS